MIGLLKKLLGTKSQRDIKEIEPYIAKCLACADQVQTLSNDELRAQTDLFRTQIFEHVHPEEEEIQQLKGRVENEENMSIDEKEGAYHRIELLEKEVYKKTEEKLLEILPKAFAVVKETARRFAENPEIEVSAQDWDRDLAAVKENIRIENNKAYYKNTWLAGGTPIVWDMVHYDVQLIGGVVLHQGKIAEMYTGEGKTLVATLPVYLNALPGKGVHVVTVNDYLAKRDSEWMGMLFQFHGLKVDCIDKHQPNSQARRDAYLADITYGTNNEFGFDYLRDNMCRYPEELVQRKHNYAIVDEVDSVLIDDARTPLIISGPTFKGDNQEFEVLKPQIERLYNEQRNLITKILAEAKQNLSGNPSKEQETKGGELLLRAHRGLPKNKALIKFLSEQGHKVLMQKTENYYMQEQSKNMHIIDEPLYFVIDEKNNSIDLTEKGIDFLSSGVNDARYYMLPDFGAEIAELEKSALNDQEKAAKKSEIMRNYAVQSERVHTLNQLMKAYALFEKDVEYVVVENQVKIVDEQTGRIMDGRRYSDGLHQAIEAKENVKVEAATQTYATITLQNYFRMYGKLAGMTGTAETEAGELWDIYKLEVVSIPTNRPVSRVDVEDLVYKTKREKYKAVIEKIQEMVNQGRPVLVGTTSVEISELLSRMLKQLGVKHNVLNAKLHKREADIVAEAGISGAVTIATNMAGRGTDIKLKEGVKEAGGLAIIGTERHESRRVDRQLRGRSGRQGDPGSSIFFVSLEDDLMRLFASHRIANIMDRLGHQEGDMIQHSMITKSIERAQRKVEENNFGIRKRLLEYDDVMNAQREVIYTKRRHALYGERLAIDIANMMTDTVEQYVQQYREERNFEDFSMEMIRTFGLHPQIGEKQFFSEKEETVTDMVYKEVETAYAIKNERLVSMVLPVISDVDKNSAGRYENIVIPITDGKKTLQVIANIKRCLENPNREIPKTIQKSLYLAVIDDAWKEHLREMDDLKQSVQNASYEQKDPLLIYKFESFELFKSMITEVNKEICSFLCLGEIPQQQAPIQEARKEKTDMSRLRETRTDEAMEEARNKNTQEAQKPQPVHVEKKVGRNDLCPCGSGKKYKSCHGKNE